jgi:murein DD-endopeptidase MepM/ murein hydrolase activator NlpD
LPSPAPLQNGFPALAAVPLALSEHDHFYFSLPVANVDLGKFTPSQRYGVIEAVDIKGQEPHLGIDIGLNSGTPIHAAAGGTVIWAGYGLLYNSPNYLDDPYGIAVVIRHDFGFEGERLYTVYGHLEQVSVKKNQRVERGDVIGLSGNTGLSSGPHLHFEVRVGVNNVYHTRNAELWLSPPEGYGVLVGRVTFTNGALMLKRLLEITSLDTGKKYSLYSYASQFKLLPDDYYNENFVLGNLPAGGYEIAIPYLAVWHRVTVEIKPGAVTYFTFAGSKEFSFDLPAEKAANTP